MLHALQEKGIKVFLASGRPPVQLPLLGKKLNAFPWDGYVLLNGQYVMDKDKHCFYKHPICKEALHSLVPFNKAHYEYLKSIGKEDYMLRVEDPVRSYTHDTYQICPRIPSKDDAEWVKHAPGMKSARWTEEFADMIPLEGGKPVGMQKILDYYGIDQKDTIAFGDGGNDMTMLEFAEIGVAMGNANDEVKSHADYVTDTSENDGILKAFQHFGIL